MKKQEALPGGQDLTISGSLLENKDQMKWIGIIVVSLALLGGCGSSGKEIKSLKEEIKMLREENNYIKAENTALKKEIDALYKKIEQITAETAAKVPR